MQSPWPWLILWSVLVSAFIFTGFYDFAFGMILGGVLLAKGQMVLTDEAHAACERAVSLAEQLAARLEE